MDRGSKMNTLDAIRQRRATKQFDAQHVMTLEEKKALLTAGRTQRF